MDRDRLISAREVEGLIAEGQLIVIYEGLALKLDGWIHKHPGGHLAIMHMVGRDASDEINVQSSTKPPSAASHGMGQEMSLYLFLSHVTSFPESTRHASSGHGFWASIGRAWASLLGVGVGEWAATWDMTGAGGGGTVTWTRPAVHEDPELDPEFEPRVLGRSTDAAAPSTNFLWEQWANATPPLRRIGARASAPNLAYPAAKRNLLVYSTLYHFEKTCKTMKAYRIGRVQQPWTNLQPPIQGGVHRKLTGADDNNDANHNNNSVGYDQDDDAELEPISRSISITFTDTDADPYAANSSTYSDSVGDTAEVSSLFSAPPAPLSSNNSSIGADDDAPSSSCRLLAKDTPSTSSMRSRLLGSLDACDGSSSSLSPSPSSCRLRNANITSDPATCREPSTPKAPTSAQLPTDRLSRETYTAALEQKEIADGIRNYPSLDPETQEAIRAEYRALHKLVQDGGHYRCRYEEYGKEMIRYTALFCAFLYFVSIGWYKTSAGFLGFFWQQIMFVAHDAGHRGITGDFVTDTVIGAFVADFCNGLSIGWWKSSHNVHHLVTNMPEHDPDNQNIPIFATSPSYFKGMYSSFYKFQFVWDKAADILVPWQKYTYYPIMCIARFNLYLLSWGHLVSWRATQLGSAWWTRWLEVSFMCCFWYLFGYKLLLCTIPDWFNRVAFVLISHSITMLLHVQITLSHWGMPTSDLGPTESFPQRQLRTTMDVDCPEWLDFFHGGLQFQAVHHLFPRVPRHNLRRVQKLVKEFCVKTGVEYKIHGFVGGNKFMLGRLDEVAHMVETLVQCSNHMAETQDFELK